MYDICSQVITNRRRGKIRKAISNVQNKKGTRRQRYSSQPIVPKKCPNKNVLAPDGDADLLPQSQLDHVVNEYDLDCVPWRSHSSQRFSPMVMVA